MDDVSLEISLLITVVVFCFILFVAGVVFASKNFQWANEKKSNGIRPIPNIILAIGWILVAIVGVVAGVLCVLELLISIVSLELLATLVSRLFGF